MKNKSVLSILLLLISFNFHGQNIENTIDTIAVSLLDRMAGVIGGLGSVSFQAEISKDVKKAKYGLVKEYSSTEVYMVGPDKMHVQSNGTDGHKGYWYNGETLVYYSFKENNYSVVDAPSDIISMIDSINTNFGIEFPAADLFYPDLVDTVIRDFDHISYLGEEEINGVNCFHIMAVNEVTNIQLWITDDAFFLPEKFLVIYKDDQNIQYEVDFTKWKLNPDLPEEIFSFEPPPGARNIAIMAKTESQE